MMAGQYNGLADLLLAATRALATSQNKPSSFATVPTLRIPPTKRWASDYTSSSGSESDSTTPMARKRGSRARHPYRRPKVEPVSNDDDDHDINARRKPTRGPAQHNEVEKKRRAYLSSCYVDLKMLVPSIANVKASNVTILQTAAGHVQELDATAEKLTAQLRAARRRREELEAQVATLRAQQRLATKAAWSPPSVGDSSGYESCGMDDEGTSAVVPDTLSAVVDDDRVVLPSFTDTVACMSAPAWGAKTKGGRMGAAPNGIDLLMLLASAGAQYAPGAAMADADADAYAYAYADGAAQGGRRHARKPARFM